MTRLFSLILLLALLHPAPLASQAQPGVSQRQPVVSHRQSVVSPRLPCGYQAEVAEILAQLNQEDWSGWVRQLSGAEAVLVGGAPVTIRSRYSPALFDGRSPAYEYVRERLASWYPADQIEEHSYQTYFEGSWQTWKNLVLTIPGRELPGRVVLLTAHLDSLASPNSATDAPGADDNASGAAALLEAARVLRGKSLPHTLRLILFSGEEQWLRGSLAYTSSRDLRNVIGVINVDMIGYDADGDRCFELHVGTLPQSQAVGQCFTTAIDAYGLDLLYEYKTNGALSASDHSSFWEAGVGAVLVLENYVADAPAQSCPGALNPDRNPYYHQPGDTFANLNPAYGFEVSRAALAAAVSLASPEIDTIVFPMVMYDFNP